MSVQTQTAEPPGVTTPGTPLPEAAAAPGGLEEAQEPLPLGALIGALRTELAGALHDRIHLVGLEFRQVGINAAQMVVLAMVSALMLCGAWMVAMIAVYMACTSQGLHWGWSLLLVLLINLAVALFAWVKALALSTAFTFPATLRMIKGHGPGNPDTP